MPIQLPSASARLCIARSSRPCGREGTRSTTAIFTRERPVTGHLVVFDGLTGGNKTGIDRGALAEFFDRLLTFRDDAVDRLAGLGLGPLADHLEHLFEALDLALCLFAVSRKGLLQLGVLCRLYHLGKNPIDLLFRVINIL